VSALSLATSLALPAGTQGSPKNAPTKEQLGKASVVAFPEGAGSTRTIGLAKPAKNPTEGVNVWIDPEGYWRFVAGKTCE
jgi:hypothetical protein